MFKIIITIGAIAGYIAAIALAAIALFEYITNPDCTDAVLCVALMYSIFIGGIAGLIWGLRD